MLRAYIVLISLNRQSMKASEEQRQKNKMEYLWIYLCACNPKTFITV